MSIDIQENVIKIPITGKHASGKFVLIDKEDYDLVSKFRWYCVLSGKNYYAHTSVRMADGKRKTLPIHRLILDVIDSKQMIDHINGNGLDNRRSNLRICGSAENQHNSRPRKGYKGVFQKKNGTFVAKICYNRKTYNIGYYDSEEDAARAYNLKAIELFGEFACLNDVDMNAMPIKREIKKTSKYIGVSWRPERNKYRSGFKVNNKWIHLGYFDSEIDAAIAYDNAARKLGRKLNFPDKVK